MRRRVLLCLTLIAVSACNGDKVVQPTYSPTANSKAISDATHSAVGFASNPDFFFLPPMVKNPNGSAKWDNGAFNASLRPTVEICASAATTEADVASAACAPLPPALTASAEAGAEQYQVNWKVPKSSTTFYRITVKVGTKGLGFADVETGSNASQLKNVATGEFIPLVDGQSLPIKFRIERYALCETPGDPTKPCTSASADISTTPITVQTGTPDASGISSTVGVIIPAQPTFPSTPITVTVASCPDLNPAVIDLRTFGNCSRVTTDPVLTQRLANPATVYVCGVGVNATMFTGLTEEQEERVTLHRYDATGPNAGIVALPHAHACTPGTPGGVASTSPSVGQMLGSLAHGQLKRAASQAVAMLAPKPLYAAMFIDQGGGGLTDFFSDFQFALPAKLEIVASTNNQSLLPGTTINPQVKVTDLGGDPVAGASVHFFTSDPGESNGTVVVTDANGFASVPWTINAGVQSMAASGRGIASPNNNGPRVGETFEGDFFFDPFQPIQAHFDAGFTGTPVETLLRTGSVQFSAVGVALFGSSSGGSNQLNDPSSNPGTLFAIDLTSAAASLVGSAGLNGADGQPELGAITFHPTTGMLYGILGSNCTGAVLVTINPLTGAATTVGTMSGSGFDGTPHSRGGNACFGGSDALAFGSDGSLYASGWNGGTVNGKLLKVNPSTGAVIEMHATTSGIAMSGLASAPSGALWASRGGNGAGMLHRIDPVTGATLSTLTLKNAAGANEVVIVSDIAFDAGGTLYASLPRENQLARVDVSTGILTRIGSYGVTDLRIAGLAIRR